MAVGIARNILILYNAVFLTMFTSLPLKPVWVAPDLNNGVVIPPGSTALHLKPNLIKIILLALFELD